MKKFHFTDLQKIADQFPDHSRTRDEILRLLKGEVINLYEYKGNIQCNRQRRRRPSKFRYNLKNLVQTHKGVEIHGSSVSIPELKIKKNI